MCLHFWDALKYSIRILTIKNCQNDITGLFMINILATRGNPKPYGTQQRVKILASLLHLLIALLQQIKLRFYSK